MNKILKHDPIQLDSFLEKYDLKLPVVEEYVGGKLEIKLQNGSFYLYIDSQQWMIFTPKSGNQIFEFYSHYNLSKGSVVCTGMGFLLRESWILKNPNLTKLTVIENSKDLIEYHKKKNPDLLEKIEILEGDVNDFELECDCLLLDHFELQTFDQIISDVVNISKKIKHKSLWFWPLEKIILAESRKKQIHFLDYYNSFRTENSLNTLPALNRDEIENLLLHYFNSTSITSK